MRWLDRVSRSNTPNVAAQMAAAHAAANRSDYATALDIWGPLAHAGVDRKSTRLNSSHLGISYAVFCLKKKKQYYKPYCSKLNVKKTSARDNIVDKSTQRLSQHEYT